MSRPRPLLTTVNTQPTQSRVAQLRAAVPVGAVHDTERAVKPMVNERCSEWTLSTDAAGAETLFGLSYPYALSCPHDITIRFTTLEEAMRHRELEMAWPVHDCQEHYGLEVVHRGEDGHFYRGLVCVICRDDGENGVWGRWHPFQNLSEDTADTLVDLARQNREAVFRAMAAALDLCKGAEAMGCGAPADVMNLLWLKALQYAGEPA